MTDPKRTQHAHRAPGRPADATLGPLIVDAVLDLLAEAGYARLTLSAVATRAGVSTATVYRRWPTKRELILAVAGQIAAAEAPDADTGSLESDLHELFEQKRRLFSGKVAAALVSLVGESAHDPDLAAAVRQSILDPTRDHLSAILNRATDRGQTVGSVDLDAAARLIVGLIVTNAALASGAAETTSATIDILPAPDAALVIQALRPAAVPP
ncbi:MAG TPA: TetR/AcrR family transcriptional regulator [Arachnia sp.]|nr:TetR/AcrR family transcriptional regulator [Arachnia sp.]HMT87785.1 TetR/AcrR family transcriptional regulator [Arachnia sp.]